MLVQMRNKKCIQSEKIAHKSKSFRTALFLDKEEFLIRMESHPTIYTQYFHKTFFALKRF